MKDKTHVETETVCVNCSNGRGKLLAVIKEEAYYKCDRCSTIFSNVTRVVLKNRSGASITTSSKGCTTVNTKGENK